MAANASVPAICCLHVFGFTSVANCYRYTTQKGVNNASQSWNKRCLSCSFHCSNIMLFIVKDAFCDISVLQRGREGVQLALAISWVQGWWWQMTRMSLAAMTCPVTSALCPFPSDLKQHRVTNVQSNIGSVQITEGSARADYTATPQLTLFAAVGIEVILETVLVSAHTDIGPIKLLVPPLSFRTKTSRSGDQ